MHDSKTNLKRTRTFIDVLEDEIRADLRKEIEAEMKAKFTPRGRADEEGQAKFDSHVLSASSTVETYLLSHLGPVTFKPRATPYSAANVSTAQGRAASANAASQARARELPSQQNSQPQANAPLHSKLLFKVVAPEQLIAVELLSRQSGQRLEPCFTEAELKTTWRKAALKTHPDRYADCDAVLQLQMACLFRELTTAYETLLDLITTTRSQAA